LQTRLCNYTLGNERKSGNYLDRG